MQRIGGYRRKHDPGGYRRRNGIDRNRRLDTQTEPAPTIGYAEVVELEREGDVESLVALLVSDQERVRSLAVEALGRMRDPREVDLLIGKLKDGRWQVRCAAAEALERLADPRAIGSLTQAMADETALVREAAERALRAACDAEIRRLRRTAS